MSSNRQGRHSRQPYSWLGAGVLGLSVGAALAAGSGVAHADSAADDNSSGPSTQSSAGSRGQQSGPSKPGTAKKAPSFMEALRAAPRLPTPQQDDPATPFVNPLPARMSGAARRAESPTPGAATTAPSTSANSLAYRVTNDWGSGHTAALTLTAGGSDLNGWTVEFDTPAEIVNIWNAQVSSRVGTHYVVANMPYNGQIAARQSTDFGYQATPGAIGSALTNITINGVVISTATPPITPALSIADVSVKEGNSGTTNASFTVTLSKPSATPVTVGYSTANGTAAAGSDYTAASGTLTFLPGTTSRTFVVKVLGDTRAEPDETFIVTLTKPSGATLTRATATATVKNDDVSATPGVSISDASAIEPATGTMPLAFTVTLTGASTRTVTVQYATADGSATAGSDYSAASGTLTFAPGETRKTVSVIVNADSLVEGNEDFHVMLSNPSGVTLADAMGMGNISDGTTGGGTTGVPMPTGGGPYVDIMTFGMFHGSSHTGMDGLAGGRTAITTEALVAYNDLRRFAGLAPATIDDVGRWAFANSLTNNAQAWGTDVQGVGLYYAMQGAKVGWIADDKYSPQIIADIERTARLGSAEDVMTMVAAYGHPGFAQYLIANGYQTAFIDTLKMEPHYGGWMHDRANGRLILEGAATAHDVNHLTVLSHDQSRPFMNDTWDWPQWPALNVSNKRVIEYFQSMVALRDPRGDNLSVLNRPSGAAVTV